MLKRKARFDSAASGDGSVEVGCNIQSVSQISSITEAICKMWNLSCIFSAYHLHPLLKNHNGAWLVYNLGFSFYKINVEFNLAYVVTMYMYLYILEVASIWVVTSSQ